MKIKKAVIPLAGLGTRFLPATKAQPKEMFPIIDKPAIQYIVEEAVASGIEDILIITGQGKAAIENHFDRSCELERILAEKGKIDLLNKIQNISDRTNIHYIRQGEALGLGHAVSCAKAFVGKEPFAVMLGDNVIISQKPCLSQLIDVYDKCKCTVLGVQHVMDSDISKYDVLKYNYSTSRLYRVDDLIEKPEISQAPSNLAILGRYIITPKIFELIPREKQSGWKEIQLTDALRSLVHIEKVFAYEFEGKRYDIGNKTGYLEAIVDMALEADDTKKAFSEYIKRIAAGL